MKYLQDLANLITVRTFLDTSIDNLHMKLSRDDIKNIQTRVQLLDRTILEYSLKLDLSKTSFETHNVVSREFTVESTEDTASVMKKIPLEAKLVDGVILTTPVVSHNNE